MNPPIVYEVTTPRSQRTHNTRRIVQSIAVPIPQETILAALVSHQVFAFNFSRMSHVSLPALKCLFSSVHVLFYFAGAAAITGVGATSFN